MRLLPAGPVILVLLLVMSPIVADTIWIGPVSGGDWFDANNWSAGVPVGPDGDGLADPGRINNSTVVIPSSSAPASGLFADSVEVGAATNDDTLQPVNVTGGLIGTENVDVLVSEFRIGSARAENGAQTMSDGATFKYVGSKIKSDLVSEPIGERSSRSYGGNFYVGHAIANAGVDDLGTSAVAMDAMASVRSQPGGDLEAIFEDSTMVGFSGGEGAGMATAAATAEFVADRDLTMRASLTIGMTNAMWGMTAESSHASANIRAGEHLNLRLSSLNQVGNAISFGVGSVS